MFSFPSFSPRQTNRTLYDRPSNKREREKGSRAILPLFKVDALSCSVFFAIVRQWRSTHDRSTASILQGGAEDRRVMSAPHTRSQQQQIQFNSKEKIICSLLPPLYTHAVLLCAHIYNGLYIVFGFWSSSWSRRRYIAYLYTRKTALGKSQQLDPVYTRFIQQPSPNSINSLLASLIRAARRVTSYFAAAAAAVLLLIARRGLSLLTLYNQHTLTDLIPISCLALCAVPHIDSSSSSTAMCVHKKTIRRMCVYKYDWMCTRKRRRRRSENSIS